MSSIVDALQTERRSYLARGLEARVAEVDAELAKHGVHPPKPETATAPAPRKRAAKKAAPKVAD